MTINIAIVPVAGLGTSVLPLTKSQPKEMLAVGRKPVVQYVVEELASNGIERILFITSQGKSSIAAHFDIDENLIQYLRETGREDNLAELDYERQNIEYFYTRQRRQLGLGHAVLCAQPLVGKEPAVVALGDSILGRHASSNIVSRMVDTYEAEKADAVIALEPVAPADVDQYGIVDVSDGAGGSLIITGAIEKPTATEAPSNLSIAARYVFSPAIYEALQATPTDRTGNLQLTDAIAYLIDQGAKVVGIKLQQDVKRYDIGNFESYFKTFLEFTLTDPEFGTEMQTWTHGYLKQQEG
ncbi:MAG: sugar phosphate nucleotidyltransferase [Planctomycetota bacterium]|nr:sugar phosphate nucleotidyltransferase [Planctomycetota bacterium]